MAMAWSWVLRGELAVGSAPQNNEDLGHLDRDDVRSVLTLCAPREVALPPGLPQEFHWERSFLPDHRTGEAPTFHHLQAALGALARLRQHGPVYVHCLAGVERSPLVAVAWLIRERGLCLLQALDYLMHVHPPTNPMPEQLAILSAWEPHARTA